MHKRKSLLTAIVMLLLPAMAQAGGFQIGEMATRATGMGSAFTGVADDASATWYNPAGLAFVEGTNVMLGGDVIFVPGTDFTSNSSNSAGAGISASAGSETFLVPHLYLSYNNAESPLSYSVGVNAPFGLKTDWPATAPFSLFNTLSQLQMVLVNGNVTFRINDHWAIAGGVDYGNMYNVDLENTSLKLSGDGDGWGGNAAIFYRGDGFSAGLSYRSRISVDLDGTAVLTAAPLSSAASTNVTLPDMVNLGVAWKPNEAWTLSAEVDWVNWDTFDSLDIVVGPPLTTLGGLPSLIQLPQNWDATFALRLGAEWNYATNMRARFGYVFDPTPISDADFSPAIPGNDRHLFSIGYSYDLNPDTSIDLAYTYVLFEDRDQTASTGTDSLGRPNALKNGSYEADVHIVAASVSARF